MEPSPIDINGWLGIAGTIITTAGTVAVAYISSKTHSAQKQIQAETTKHAEDNKDEIIGHVNELKHGLETNSRLTVATVRALINQAYDQNKTTKKITTQTWQNVMELHDAYKRVQIDGHTPNSWCDQIVEEMKSWEKV